MWKILFNLFKKKRHEYLYFYILGSDIFGIQQNLHKDLQLTILKDLKKSNKKKEIVDHDFFTDKTLFESIIIITTDFLKNPIYHSIVLEIYAFLKKKKDFTIFSHNYTIINYKYYSKEQEERYLTIFKFKVDA